MKKTSNGSTPAASADDASAAIDARIDELRDWRGDTLSRVRQVIHDAVPAVVEELKWRGTPVWSSDGIICTGETYKDKVKLTFAHGAALKDPAKLFNSSLEGNTRRAIDIQQTDAINGKALQALLREAAAFNAAKKSASPRAKKASKTIKA
ncbi:DUF1801 domain-containing protein [Pseudoxanthomonas indica]|uniref:YdhG-like domain-containing protein n=1 Tax=Pseudoxanthomonas indica TaxID=428993 RepID=A0A1T5M003_9GAMM|nr:DUF1801 domain-containing protein [Pseudoxanthomonas indica]GGD59797.1 hypothetical protein GCM10007235_35000 [Pseudoxanthomonas indica]SKC81556.1 hypothetical protein SAMN06296058_3531 [Pseudoxanthomonas indica]